MKFSFTRFRSATRSQFFLTLALAFVIDVNAQVSYTPFTSACNADLTLSGVNITDPTGVPLTGTLMPRIYYRKNSEAWISQTGTMTSGTPVSSNWNFVISTTALGGVVASDVISYFVIAQNTGGTTFSNPSAGLVAPDVNTITSPPTSPSTVTVALPTLNSLVTSRNVCYNTSSAQSVTYNFSSTSGAPNQYTLTWSAAGPADALAFTALPGSGITVNVPAGTADGTYTGTLTVRNSTSGCSNTYTLTLIVDALPTAIAGGPYVCTGATGTLSSTPAGGTWASANAGIAAIGSSTGIVTGGSVGATTITYTATTGCRRTAGLTVNPLPALITGALTVCEASVTTLANSTFSGSWSSSNPSVASIGSSTGIAMGLSAGTTVISYTIPTGCSRTAVLTVQPLPAAITGSTPVCPGSTLSLANATAGGTWSSSVTGVATVSLSTGVVTGVANGTTVISYRLGTGCTRTTVVTVNSAVAAITGTASACQGLTSTLSNADAGGTWASADATIAVVDASGVVTGNVPGTTTITYTAPSGCARTITFTVRALPAAIGGTTAVCEGGTTVLTNVTGGGTWSTASTLAPVGPSTGVVTGMAAGTAEVTYTLSTGCRRTTIVTVHPLPAAITGSSPVCVASTATLTSATTGGTWTSSAPSVASIGSATGIVTGIAAGTTRITYTVSTGCRTTMIYTVNALPATIGGSSFVCENASISLSNSTPGGTWTSSDPAVATITASTAIVNGVTEGVTTITYRLASGCERTKTLTVNGAPAAITGTLAVCALGSTTLSNDSTGGAWTSSSTSIAYINFTSGVVSALAPGTTTITYTTPNSCRQTAVVTVNPQPGAIVGPASLCVGYSVTLYNGTPGGTWTSTNTAAVPITAAGIVTGISPASAIISYALPTGCFRTTLVTVHSSPAPVTGTFTVCAGATTTLTSSTSGGTWSSSNTNAFTAPGGLITGIAAGTATITYTLPTNCLTTTDVTINPVPDDITGINNICIGAVTTLANTMAGGTWSSSNTAVAIIASSGIVTGLSAGTTTITYALSSGCRKTRILTVNPTPAVISGSLTVCTTFTTTLYDASVPGVWSSSNPAVAVIGTGTGIVMGASPGTSIITYTTAAGCSRTVVVTVNQSPDFITGTSVICSGNTTTLSNSVGGGLWSMSSTIATVGSTTGIVTGVTYGNVNVTYTLANGCRRAKMVTINPLPANINGTATVCVGAIATLTNATTGGTWSSSTPTIAATTLVTGYVSGVATGTAYITYTLSTGCFRTGVVTVTPSPAAITGTTVLCQAATTSLANSVAGGTWSSNNTGVATVGSTSGVVTGVAGGTAIITYRLATGCREITNVTINPMPAPISGMPFVCVGSSTFVSNTVAGGTWSIANPSIATIDAVGNVVGVAAGTTTVTYTVGTGCYRTMMLVVNPLPAAITGTTALCPGAGSTLSNTTVGGTWTSSTPTVATIGFSSGIVAGLTTGTTNVTYTLATGCRSIAVVTVHAIPAPIAGPDELCEGATVTLSNISPGGTWSSSETAVGTIGEATGVLSGVTAGTTTISYRVSATGCARTREVTVNPLPSTISGTLSTCVASTTVLGNDLPGGAWQSSNLTVASAGSSTGVITGVSPGTVTVTYTLPTGCRTFTTVTVHPAATPITGTAAMCAGASITLANATPGGTWNTGHPSVATVNAETGVVTGVASGIGFISYTTPTGCKTMTVVTVNLSPGPISGSLAVCLGSTSDLNNYIADGEWISTNPAVATIDDSTGVVTGVSLGTTTISYTIAGCTTSSEVTVNLAPGPITGGATVCRGATMQLANSVSGGVWNSSNGAIASISSTGVVTGVFTGTAIISYTIGSDCHATQVITVAEAPPAALITVHPKDSVMCTNTMFQNFGTPEGQPAGVLYTWSVTNAELFREALNKQYTLVNFNRTGRAVVRLSSSLSATGCRLTDSVVINVNNDTSLMPEVAYYSDKFVCSDNTADSYQWGYDDNETFDSTVIRWATFQDVTVTEPDFEHRSYWVMTSHGDCKQKAYYSVPTPAAVTTVQQHGDITVFPNPASDLLNVSMKGFDLNELAIQVTTITGVLVPDVQLTAGSKAIDIRALAPGTYTISFYKGQLKLASRIFVKQ